MFTRRCPGHSSAPSHPCALWTYILHALLPPDISHSDPRLNCWLADRSGCRDQIPRQRARGPEANTRKGNPTKTFHPRGPHALKVLRAYKNVLLLNSRSGPLLRGPGG